MPEPLGHGPVGCLCVPASVPGTHIILVAKRLGPWASAGAQKCYRGCVCAVSLPRLLAVQVRWPPRSARPRARTPECGGVGLELVVVAPQRDVVTGPSTASSEGSTHCGENGRERGIVKYRTLAYREPASCLSVGRGRLGDRHPQVHCTSPSSSLTN